MLTNKSSFPEESSLSLLELSGLTLADAAFSGSNSLGLHSSKEKFVTKQNFINQLTKYEPTIFLEFGCILFDQNKE